MVLLKIILALIVELLSLHGGQVFDREQKGRGMKAGMEINWINFCQTKNNSAESVKYIAIV